MTNDKKLILRRAAALMPVATALALSGCGPKKAAPVAAPPPPPPPPVVIVTPDIPPPPVEPVPPELVYASRGEDLWHLRSALNVAALICDAKVQATLVPSYNRLLTTHKSLLSAAVQTELDQFKALDKKKWQALYDTHMTKVYNQYSLTQKRAKFCEKADELASKAGELTAEDFSAQATAMIFRLNRAGEIDQPPVRTASASPQTLAAPIP